MIFQYTHEQVMDSSKTITSRLQKPEPDGTSVWGEMLQFPGGVPTVVRGNGVKWCVKWQVGKVYAVQPYRTAKGIGHIQITAIRAYDVRDITADEAQREGFENRRDFWVLWQSMHDKDFLPTGYSALVRKEVLQDWLAQRPAERYSAWQLTFRLVTE